MSLFVVVQRNKANGHEYLVTQDDGFTEYAEAARAASAERVLEGDLFDVYVGRVERVEEDNKT